MPGSDIKQTLARLHAELENTSDVDEDLKTLLRDVDADIHSLLKDDTHRPDDVHGITERLEEMAAGFAAQHPHTERFFREVIEALGRMGI
jgi:hypothetical protein